MDDIYNKTLSLIETLDKSECVFKLTKAKEVLLNDLEILNKVKNSKDLVGQELISIRKELYENKDYAEYQEAYNELFYVIQRINNLFLEIINNRGCHYEGD